MIDVHIQVEQNGSEMKQTISAKTDGTSTPKEMEIVERIVGDMQKRIIDLGGSATFVERNFDLSASDDAIPAAPDLTQPGNCPCCHKPNSAHIAGRCPFGLQ